MTSDAVPDWVPAEFRPNERQQRDWMVFVLADDGVDQAGWWVGWCPLHDTERDPSAATAEYNFKADSMRCLAVPSCHDPKKGMTLTQVKARLADG